MATLREAGTAAGGFALALLLLFGISALPNDTHVCPENGLTMECARISSTGLTCYPSIDTNKGYKRCTGGTWELIDKTIEEEPEEEPIVGASCKESDRYKVCVYRK